ncbi:hypothetical protein POSPLADRAFT_1175479 [Postia placenta MAD-698-R-SB12]|uniref:DH domain-containing protein n=1 Tax=Postia placenta MAD-698-R-SB12 TaxID=670580 RepID=A0A1X6NEC6_9APHY|nr:hypothetical protein POSPLADRAFT_1175479 [Postia placenta MAD-698-R-SB12]OSX66796.1 hypothetical protein POSPLADRAFT_1175479 [Postia placenta MAD-698-R-SB12]
MRPIDEHREAKRRKVINEFHETERSYVDGLDLIYSHFLSPIIASLDTPQQLLDRSELTSIFSNFIDIWNLHRSFYTALTTFLDSSTSTSDVPPAPLSPVLLAHFPYLSLYTPFVTSFSDALASYAFLLSAHHAFALFVAKQEADPRCGKLKFRDWLLTIVQRCPRYLLLLKDLISCTDPDDPEYTQLTAVHTLVSKITSSLNASLHTHAQTLALLALQRNTANLPFRLITPGRTFLKRAPLMQLEGSMTREREFLLFSDCIIWLANADGDLISNKWEHSGNSSPGGGRPALVRTRSKSDADMPVVADALRRKESVLKFRLPVSPKRKARHASSGTDERWVYKGYVDLVDVEVIVSPPREADDERRFELLSPQQSFAVYAANEEERDEWSTAIRNAKASLLVSLNVMQPNSTLTSSSSTNHLRRTLQALPYAPEQDLQHPKRGRTFFILDESCKDSHKPARACDACYDTVFPVLDYPRDRVALSGTTHAHLTLSGLKSMPSLVLSDRSSNSPSALMVVDLESPKRMLTRIDDDEAGAEGAEAGPSVPAIRLKHAPRPRSYVQILEDFQEHGRASMGAPQHSAGPSVSSFSLRTADDPDERDEDASRELSPASSSYAGSSLPPTPRKENTVRRHKRFSLPALALQTSSVTARPSVVGEGSSRRFSLMLGKGGTLSQTRGTSGERASRLPGDDFGRRESVAAGKLSELLGRSQPKAADTPANAKAPPASAPELESSAVLKAVRAHEHDRQRARKTVEVERTRERKERKRKAGAGTGAARQPKVGRKGSADAKGVTDAFSTFVEENLPPVAREGDDDAAGAGRWSPAHATEVDITVLIKPAKVHKRRGDDFEVIPAVRSVIVLDDSVAVTPEVDEPWEHISAEDGEDGVADPPPSYAQIAASAV